MLNNDINLSPVDKETKAAFAKVCESAGLTPREALNLFTQSVVEQGDIPFNIKAMQLETSMYGGSRSQQIQVEPESKNDDDFFHAEAENRFFNELMGI